MKKILAIGNSFSQDATAYLYDIAKQDNVEIKVVNLYIGGCSLQTHYENAMNDIKNYTYELNGQTTQRLVSIKESLLEDDWDFVTMQQASHDSGIEETYFPYIKELSNYVGKYAPNAKQLIHQTWAYEIDSDHSEFYRYNNNQITMYNALKDAYLKVTNVLGLEIIPCGDVIQALRNIKEFDYANGGQTLCRDGFHMHLIYGRYATAAVWYESIFKKSIMSNTYIPPHNDDFNKRLIDIIKKTTHGLCTK